jgi:hypothetical protein
LTRLTGALATGGGSLPSVLTAIREREAKRDTLDARLAALAQVADSEGGPPLCARGVVMAAIDGQNPLSIKLRLKPPNLVDDPGRVQ